MDDDADAPATQQAAARERRVDGQRKRIRMLNELLRELDMAVFMELLVVYHCDCSFFWLAIKAGLHAALLTPVPDSAAADRPPDEPKPFLPLLLLAFAASVLLHLAWPAPAAGEDTRGYLHGGLLIDFIGQQGPTSRWTLAALDAAVLCLQMAMVAVHVKRRELKQRLATTDADAAADDFPSDTEALADPDAHADVLDALTSGQCIIGDFSLLDTLLEENKTYAAYRLTRSDTAANDMPDTLRRFSTLRARFRVGGG